MFLKSVSYVAFDNDFDTNERAWNPEIWAQETLMILEENMVVSNLVHTDFANEIASFGDTVNTRLPGEFTAKRKGTNDDVTVQAATAVKVPVVMNQHVHTSFLIRDGEESRSFVDLVNEYLRPAAKSLATHIDKVLLGQAYQFLGNSVGDGGEVTATSTNENYIKNLILDAREVMNVNKVPLEGRSLILAPRTETEALKLDIFTTADKVGDEGTALREASLGRKLGFDMFMCQNVPSPQVSAFTADADDIAAASKGATTLVSDDGSAWAVGEYISLYESTLIDRVPYRITAISTNDMTISHGLRQDCAANTDARRYTTGTVDLTGHTVVSAYPAGYDKEIKVDGSGEPHEGQICSFNTAGTPNVALDGEYSIIGVREPTSGVYYITLDRPLETAITNDDVVGYGPWGDYNLAINKDAIALVVRPLAPPRAGLGALSSVAQFNNLAIRVTMTYLGMSQGTLVTLDFLCGVKVLDVDRGAVLVG